MFVKVVLEQEWFRTEKDVNLCLKSEKNYTFETFIITS